MITVEEKLEIFHKIVYRELEEKFLKAIEELEEKNQQLLEDKRKELEGIRKEIIRKKINMAKIEINETRAKAMENTKSKLRQKRKEIQDDLMKAIVLKAEGFVETREYYEYLCKIINKYLKEFENREILLYVREKDKISIEGCLRGLMATSGKVFKVETMDDEKIGGFIISDNNRTYNIDHSLKSLIEEKEYLIGQTLNLTLGKAGVTND